MIANQAPRPADAVNAGDVSLHPAETRLIEYIRALKWGSVEITVQDSRPVMVKVAVQTTKLT